MFTQQQTVTPADQWQQKDQTMTLDMRFVNTVEQLLRQETLFKYISVVLFNYPEFN